ncbi:hypothetical protein PG999_010249 [Apiospora kogelbergensis]|uniref:Uncharacterized protein n=1 Tax=Apiospora kogelbergensis TaxID=1337665 RepID=A0AAW0QB42_9PEZI
MARQRAPPSFFQGPLGLGLGQPIIIVIISIESLSMSNCTALIDLPAPEAIQRQGTLSQHLATKPTGSAV